MTDSEPPRYASSPQEALDSAVVEVLGKDNPHAYSTISFVQRSLMQFNLATQYEAHEILNDAYLRGREYIQSGGIIRSPYSWLKSTSLNIIREHSRQQKKIQTLDPELVELLPCLRPIGESAVSLSNIDNNWKALINALKVLEQTEPDAARLLRLRAQGLSWKEVHEQLVREDGIAQSETTLRQQACRAKKALRKIYHAKTSDAADLSMT